MKIFSRLLILKHTHPYMSDATDDQDSDSDSDDAAYLSSERDCARRLHLKYNLFYSTRGGDKWDKSSMDPECVSVLRENTMVSLANIAGALDLSQLDDELQIELYSHGLLHWSICPSTEARDPLSTLADTSTLSAQRLAIETLSKMTIKEINVDLILHTVDKMRPWIHSLIQILCTEWLPRRDEQTIRELAIVLLTAMAKSGNQLAAQSIAKHASSLLTFIEDFEENARRIYQHHQHHHYHLDEDALGTTVEMLRRTAKCLLYVTQFSQENSRFIVKFEQRLLDLITSSFVDAKVSQLLAEVLFHCSK